MHLEANAPERRGPISRGVLVVDLVLVRSFCLFSPSALTFLSLRRHVILPTDVARLCPKNKLLSEQEWRNLNVQQSRGWEHYAVHK